MKITGAARTAAVVGWPVAHSLSPALHNAWIAAAGLDAIYVPLAVAPARAADALKAVGVLGLAGVNVTVPHKETALAVADEATLQAKRLGAANLLVSREDGSLVADNTDHAGFLAGLEGAAFDRAAPAVILGAGGAARAAAFALSDAGVKRIVIVNRSPARAAALARAVGAEGAEMSVRPWSERDAALAGAGLVVNSTNLGMRNAPALELSLDAAPATCAVYDLVYTPRETALLAAARARGMPVIEGLTMLVGQARPSFKAFFGQEPPALDAIGFLAERLEKRA